MEDDIKHPPYTPVPESTQLAGEAWSWRQPESVDRQTNQQEGCQYTPENITSLEEELDDDIKHPAYTAEPENTPAGKAWSWRQPELVLGLLEPGDEDDEVVEGAGAPRRRRSQRIDNIICDLEQTSRLYRR